MQRNILIEAYKKKVNEIPKEKITTAIARRIDELTILSIDDPTEALLQLNSFIKNELQQLFDSGAKDPLLETQRSIMEKIFIVCGETQTAERLEQELLLIYRECINEGLYDDEQSMHRMNKMWNDYIAFCN